MRKKTPTIMEKQTKKTKSKLIGGIRLSLASRMNDFVIF